MNNRLYRRRAKAQPGRRQVMVAWKSFTDTGDEIVRPSWIKGIRTEGTRVAYAILRCTCNTDTIFEFTGNGKPPIAKCCVNAPAFPRSADFTEHLRVVPKANWNFEERLKQTNRG
jgi:hypothetical protein